ncbi:M3 family metallopeptidase [Abyssibius alkaniclasticus]|uniref:M3 family metallopeptidase n=1 Tax=Abyssibius alkaniclasticus TaxID=2881234 RepID=UPI004058926B
MNPLLQDWTAPFGMPPFAEIKPEHYAEAFAAGFAEARAHIEAIATNPEAPGFANTVDALERADALLSRVSGVFDNISSADSSPELQALERDLAPQQARFASELASDKRLYARLSALDAQRADLGLSGEQEEVLKHYLRMFRRAGAHLEAGAVARLKEIAARMASLGTQFTQNLLKDEAAWEMPLAADDLAGLPEDLVEALAAAAGERGHKGHCLTLSRALIMPFLQFSNRRDLRKLAFEAWEARGANGGATDNRAIVREMLELRAERAQLLGYGSFSALRLEAEMAGTPEAVRGLLARVWEPARSAALRDADALQELMAADGVQDDLRPWDWRRYATSLQKRDFDIDENEVKPYLQLDAMIEAGFDVANKLFGLEFTPLEIPLYHPDARAWEVREGARHIGVFIGDYFARPSKRSGAWCWRFRPQQALDGQQRPIVVNVCNSAKPPKGSPALLTFDDARTLFHEFGHALHQLLSDVTYPSVSGTSVPLDFVELPSQLFEHWLATPEVLRKFARHYKTGQAMPEDLIARIKAAEDFDQGFATVEFIASAMVDLDLHSGPPPADPMQAQAATLDRLAMPAAIRMRHALPHFAHIFAGDGYASGYYSYMWSEVMDADAFEAFEGAGDVFDPATAQRLRKHILAAGGAGPAEAAYIAFRGRMPGVEALLRGRGFPVE